MKIVVVEDELRTRKSIIKLIGRISEDYLVVGEAEDGAEGLAVIEKNAPDLIITDIRMPNIDGLEMIRRIKQNNEWSKFIILSGYAEFHYAQQAVKLGIDEYLLKPITVSDLVTSLQTIEQSFRKDRRRQQISASQAQPAGQLLTKVLTETEASGAEDFAELRRRLDGAMDGCALIVVRFEPSLKGVEKEAFLKKLKDLAGTGESGESQSLMARNGNELVLLQSRPWAGTPLRFLETLRAGFDRHWWSENLVAGYAELTDLNLLPGAYAELGEKLKWSMVLEEGSIIFADQVARLCPVKLDYPKEIETRIITRIQTRNFEAIGNDIDAFFAELRTPLHEPDDMREAVMRLAGAMLYAIHQADTELNADINNNKVIGWLEKCHHPVKMKEVLTNLIDQMVACGREETNQCYSLVVWKALEIIRDEYHSDLSLDYIARRLHITPEYLSALFTREFGKKLITYLTEYRINKSKELLASDRYKIYEIARMVGYPDVKYYCKVFKKVTGYSTGEYLKINA